MMSSDTAHTEGSKGQSLTDTRLITLKKVDGSRKQFTAGDIVSARDYLVSGNCHSLALSLHQITGFAFACFRDIKPEKGSLNEHLYQPHIRHVAVIDPAGWILDGYGVSSVSEVTENYSWELELFGSPDDLMSHIVKDAEAFGRVWLPPDPVATISFAYRITYMYYLGE